MPSATDALGHAVRLQLPARRIISLVPSITETVAPFGKADCLIAVTTFCAEPPRIVAPLPKVGGTKNPDIAAIVAHRPDLVLANKEENRHQDVDALRHAGLNVFVGFPRTATASADELESIAHLLDAGATAGRTVSAIRGAIGRQEALNPRRPRVRVFCPIWRNPYMAVGADTYAGDVLRLIDGDNVFARHGSDSSYPRVTAEDVVAADPQVVLLPDEPFRFRDRHRDEIMTLPGLTAARNQHVFLVDGRWLTWYGPRIVTALPALERLLERARPEWRAPPDDGA